jgi:hypothetical protein
MQINMNVVRSYLAPHIDLDKIYPNNIWPKDIQISTYDIEL